MTGWKTLRLPLGITLGLLLLFSLLETPGGTSVRESLWTVDNARFILCQWAWLATAALGMMLIIVIGGLDLSAAAIIALAGNAAAWLITQRYGTPGLALLLGAAVGVIAGLLNGLATTATRLPSLLVTLGSAGIFAGLAAGLASLTARPVPVSWLGGLLAPFPRPSYLIFPPGVWALFLIALGLGVGLSRTVPGVHLLAVGSNDRVAELCGVRITLIRLLAFGTAGLLYGWSGVMQAGLLKEGLTVTPGLLPELITAVIIGGVAPGQARVTGTLLGAFAIVLLRNGAQQAGWPIWAQAAVTLLLLVTALLAGRIGEKVERPGASGAKGWATL